MIDPYYLGATLKLPRIEKSASVAIRNRSVADFPTVQLPTPVTLRSEREQQEASISPRASEPMVRSALEGAPTAVMPSVVVKAVAVVEGSSRAKTEKKKKKWVGLLFRCGVTLAMFFFLFKSVSWLQIWSAFLRLDPAIALIGLVIGFYTLVVSGYQWQCLLRGERIQIDLTRLVNLYMVGIAFNHFLPSSMGGDVVKVYYVAREGKNMAGSASAAIMARITGFFGMLLVAYPSLLIWSTSFSSQVITLLLSLSGVVLLIVLGAFCLTLLFARLVNSPALIRLTTFLLPGFLCKKLVRSKILSKAIDIGNALVASTKKPGPMIGSILFGVMFHIVACLNYFSFGMALHMTAPFYFYLIAIPLVSLVAFIPVSINGFGLRESTLVFVFSTVHVPAATALLLAFVMDIQMLLFAFVGMCVYIVMGEMYRRETRKKLAQL